MPCYLAGPAKPLGGKMAAMDENPYKSPFDPELPKKRAPFIFGKRAPGYHPFEFFRPGWFIAGILFLPIIMLIAWIIAMF